MGGVGYSPMPMRTGYDQVIAHRTDDLYATTAEQDGKVVELTDSIISVEYADGTGTSVKLGERYGVSAGTTSEHLIITDFKLNAKVKAGDVIAYNPIFFEPDFFTPNQVVWKAGALARTALLESQDTLEDSSAISPKLGAKVATMVTKKRIIPVEFEQSVTGLVMVGDEIDDDDILMYIEDAVTADNKLFDADSIKQLSAIAGMSPKAKAHGTVKRIEVLYNGELDDMSDSLRALAVSSNRRVSKQAKETNDTVTTGLVTGNVHIDGNQLTENTAVIIIYVSGLDPANTGDKAVLSHSLKTVISRVMEGENKSEDGEDIDIIFGYHSIQNRVTLSPELTGTTNTLLRVLSKRVAETYRG